ncbi:MAG TPA: hypothetical protein PKX92_10120 [Edaphocola sp.]|nr:hypothetical protein [Edaphocola sp.]
MKKISLLTLCFSGISIPVLYAQSVGPSVVNTSGGSQVIAGNTYEYSIGQPFEMISKSVGSYIITTGVLQPQYGEGTGVNDPLIKLGDIQVFPNPLTSNYISIQPRFKTKGVLECVFTNVLGQVVLQKKLELQNGSQLQNLMMPSLVAGHYNLLLIWTAGEQQQKFSFKIEKIQ